MNRIVKFKKQKKDVDKHKIYKNAYERTLTDIAEKIKSGELDGNKYDNKLIYYMIKYINTFPEPEYVFEAEYQFNMVRNSLWIIQAMSPRYFMTLFPIDKYYNGHKYGCKDYFYVKEYLNTLDLDAPIGQEEINHFLFEYMNYDINKYMVKTLMIASNLRRIQGEKGIMEEFAEKHGIKTYQKMTNDKGETIFVDTDKLKKKEKPSKSHLQVIK